MGEDPEASDRREKASPIRSRSLVFAFRLVLLVAAASALAASVVVWRRPDANTHASSRRYVCPMHAEITSTVPGECPICRMPLEPLGGPDESVAPFNASTFQTYDFVRRRSFGQEVHAPAWVDDDGDVTAHVYADEVAGLEHGARGVFVSSATPSLEQEIHLIARAPEAWDRATLRVHFQLSSSGAAVAPGTTGWVRLPARRRDLEVIPYAAILQSAEGAYVLVAATDGRTVSKRLIETGRVIGGQAIVVSGLHFQERILVRSAFFVDAERRMRGAAAVEVTP